MKKIYCFLLFKLFRLKEDGLYLWLILDSETRAGMPRFDDFRDKSGERSMRADRLDDVVLKKLLADDYYNSVKIDIRKVEAIVGLSILDIFEDNPVFVKFPKLKGLARSRSFELSYYGRVRGE